MVFLLEQCVRGGPGWLRSLFRAEHLRCFCVCCSGTLNADPVQLSYFRLEQTQTVWFNFASEWKVVQDPSLSSQLHSGAKLSPYLNHETSFKILTFWICSVVLTVNISKTVQIGVSVCCGKILHDLGKNLIMSVPDHVEYLKFSVLTVRLWCCE